MLCDMFSLHWKGDIVSKSHAKGIVAKQQVKKKQNKKQGVLKDDNYGCEVSFWKKENWRNWSDKVHKRNIESLNYDNL